MNCKPGDLAIVIGAQVTPEMIGHIVEVVSAAHNGDVFETDLGEARLGDPASVTVWRVRSCGALPLPWRLRDGRLAHAVEMPVFDTYLRPLNGAPIDEETHGWVSI